MELEFIIQFKVQLYTLSASGDFCKKNECLSSSADVSDEACTTDDVFYLSLTSQSLPV